MRVLLGALALLAACGTTPEDHRVLGNAQFGDIPVPRGATYQNSKERSFSYLPGANFRCGQFRYHYDDSVESAARFFRRMMVRAPYNWKLEAEDGTASGSVRFIFRKDDERCTVDIDYVPGTRKNNIPKVFLLVRLNYEYH